MLDLAIRFVLASQKAVAGWLAGALVAFLAEQGFDLPGNAGDVFQAVGLGLIGFVIVWFSPKNKE